MMSSTLPAIPVRRYFTIGEVSKLCDVKAHVLRYWEQEFSQLRPTKRRGNRRYYQHHEVLIIRRIRELLYEQGFTISGARNQLEASSGSEALSHDVTNKGGDTSSVAHLGASSMGLSLPHAVGGYTPALMQGTLTVHAKLENTPSIVRTELLEIRRLLTV